MQGYYLSPSPFLPQLGIEQVLTDLERVRGKNERDIGLGGFGV